MALTPSADDPKRNEELKRRAKDPDSFGIGGHRTQKLVQKTQDEKDKKK